MEIDLDKVDCEKCGKSWCLLMIRFDVKTCCYCNPAVTDKYSFCPVCRPSNLHE